MQNEADEPGATFAKMTFEKYDNDFGEGKNSWLSLSKENVQNLMQILCADLLAVTDFTIASLPV